MRPDSQPMTKWRLNWTMAALFVSIFLTQLDQTIVSTALPTMAAELNGFGQMSWVFTVYMLASTAVMPIAGKLSDLFGRKSFYLFGLVLFVAGSGLCGTADSMLQLILFRGLQGLGAGFLVPITYTLVFSLMPKERSGLYHTLYMSVFALSSVIGPGVGALVTEQLNWRWNFYINLPLGVLALAVLGRLLAPAKRADERAPVDAPGALLLAASTLAFLLALKIGGGEVPWASLPIALFVGFGTLALVFFVRTERRAREPILPFELFRDRVICGTLAATFLQGILMYASLVYIPLFVQGGLGGDAGDAGGALTPMMLAVMVGASVGNATVARWSWRTNIMLAMAATGAGMLAMTFVGLDVNPWAVRGIMALVGIGIGVMMTVGQMAVTYSAEEKMKGAATSTVGFFRTVGGVLGTAVTAAIVNARLSISIAERADVPGGSGTAPDVQTLLQAGASLPPESASALKEAVGGAVRSGFWFLAAIAAVGLAASFWIGAARLRREAVPGGEPGPATKPLHL